MDNINKMDICKVNTDHYDNEGFLYINKHSTETFVKGEIRDINMNLICPGVIVPIINPIKETTRDVSGDEHLVSIESCLPHITHYYHLQKGKKIRIYWNQLNKMFMVSTEHKIYTYSDSSFYVDTVNFDLLDKNLCYYATVNSLEKKLILTNIVNKEHPHLLDSYDIYEDLAFMHHIDKTLVKCPVDALTAKKMIDEQLETFNNGVLFILADGRQIEYRNWHYNYYCMLEKPETMSLYIYFLLCLNKYAEGETFADYYHSLHEFINEYLDFFPEYKETFTYMSKKLLNYAVTEEQEQSAQEQSAQAMSAQAKCDQAKITAIKNLLDLDPEELLLVLIKY